ncbi:MAG: class I tRNA ligase family protein, partial [Patescibacteria group bacterium]
VFSQAVSPIIPFISEYIYRHLTGEASVHLTDWPAVATPEVIDQNLITAMAQVRRIVEAGHAFRKTNTIAVKQPLASLTVKGNFEDIATDSDLVALIKDELNVEEVRFVAGEQLAVDFDTKLTDHLTKKGQARELVRAIQEARKAAACRLDEVIDVILPDWPTEFEDYLKQQTLVKQITKGATLTVVRK